MSQSRFRTTIKYFCTSVGNIIPHGWAEVPQSSTSPVSFLDSGISSPLTTLLAFYGQDNAARSKLEDEIRDACLDYGFFQLRNHGIPENLQKEILRQSEDFFNLPDEVKDKYNKGK